MNPGIVIRAFDLLFKGISDINVSKTTDDGTLGTPRCCRGFEVAFHYPFGTGWNTESQILQFWFGSAVPASHSYAVRLAIELGLAGVFAYAYVMYRHAAPLLKASARAGVISRSGWRSASCASARLRMARLSSLGLGPPRPRPGKEGATGEEVRTEICEFDLRGEAHRAFIEAIRRKGHRGGWVRRAAIPLPRRSATYPSIDF